MPVRQAQGLEPVERLRPAFTLIELLVVVAIIAALAGGISMALRDTGGSGLMPAQTTLATMIGSARAQAAVNQTEAIVAIYALRPTGGDGADKFLRVLQVFRNDTPGAAAPRWVAVGNPVTLPVGVYFVPPSTSGLLASGVVWPANPPLLSNVSGPTNLRQTAGIFSGAVTAYTLQFNADSTVQEIEARNLSFVRFVVATGVPTPTGPQFNNANAVRGVLVRRTGAVAMVNEPLAF